jgi:hypothetical protein
MCTFWVYRVPAFSVYSGRSCLLCSPISLSVQSFSGKSENICWIRWRSIKITFIMNAFLAPCCKLVRVGCVACVLFFGPAQLSDSKEIYKWNMCLQAALYNGSIHWNPYHRKLMSARILETQKRFGAQIIEKRLTASGVNRALIAICRLYYFPSRYSLASI